MKLSVFVNLFLVCGNFPGERSEAGLLKMTIYLIGDERFTSYKECVREKEERLEGIWFLRYSSRCVQAR